MESGGGVDLVEEAERVYLTAMTKLREFLTKALGEEGEIFEISPMSLDARDFSCSSYGRKIRVG